MAEEGGLPLVSFPSACVFRLLVAWLDMSKELAPLRNEKRQEKGTSMPGFLLTLLTQTLIRLKLDMFFSLFRSIQIPSKSVNKKGRDWSTSFCVTEFCHSALQRVLFFQQHFPSARCGRDTCSSHCVSSNGESHAAPHWRVRKGRELLRRIDNWEASGLSEEKSWKLSSYQIGSCYWTYSS